MIDLPAVSRSRVTARSTAGSRSYGRPADAIRQALVVHHFSHAKATGTDLALLRGITLCLPLSLEELPAWLTIAQSLAPLPSALY
jgi:hypothetical protein